MKKLSIIVPIYNVEKYIEECLLSILKTEDENIEIILVNDGSEDNSMKIIEKYFQDSRIKILNKKNGGLSSARNAGLKMATGEYIAFVDSDDWIEIDGLLKLYEIAKKSSLDMVMGNGYYYPKGEKLHKSIYIGKTNGINILKNMLKNRDYLETAWKSIYKRNFIEVNKIKFIEELLHEDTPFTFECLLKASNMEQKNIFFYNYRERENSITTTKSEKNYLDILYGIKVMLKLYNKINKKNIEINSYLIGLYYITVKKLKKIDKNILFNLIKLNRFNLKDWLKIIMLLMLLVKLNKIQINEEV